MVENSTIENNPDGAGVMVDSNGVLNDDCLTKNGQYGFQTYSGSDSVPVTNLTITNNEISYNDTQNYDTDGTGDLRLYRRGQVLERPGRHGDGELHPRQRVGGAVDGHQQHRVRRERQLLLPQLGRGHHIRDLLQRLHHRQHVRRQRLDRRPQQPGHRGHRDQQLRERPRVPGAYNTESVISGNVLTDNWGGVDIYEDSDRFCGTQSDNTSNDYCTLVNPSVYSVSSCTAHDTAAATPGQSPDYYDNCRWKSQNILVTDNTLNLTPSNIGTDCTRRQRVWVRRPLLGMGHLCAL